MSSRLWTKYTNIVTNEKMLRRVRKKNSFMEIISKRINCFIDHCSCLSAWCSIVLEGWWADKQYGTYFIHTLYILHWFIDSIKGERAYHQKKNIRRKLSCCPLILSWEKKTEIWLTHRSFTIYALADRDLFFLWSWWSFTTYVCNIT